jgi:hypothetical protein
VRRLRAIVALGALLSVLGGVVKASPALAGRGPKWQPPRVGPALHPARIVLRVQAPGGRPGQFTKVLKAADGSMTFLFTRRRHGLVHERANGEDHYRARGRARGSSSATPTALLPRCIRGGTGPSFCRQLTGSGSGCPP